MTELKNNICLHVNMTCLSSLDFSSIMNRLEKQSDGTHVNYIELFTLLGVCIRPGDLEGVSAKITQASEEAEAQRQADLADR